MLPVTRLLRWSLATAIIGCSIQPSRAAPQGDLATEFFTDSVNLPIHLASPAGESKLFVAEQLGRIWVVEPNGTRLPTPYVDFSAEVFTNLTAGFLGFTFHPDYASNGYVFVFFTTTDPSGADATALVRYTRSATDPYRADPASRVELLRIPQPRRGPHGLHGTDGGARPRGRTRARPHCVDRRGRRGRAVHPRARRERDLPHRPPLRRDPRL